MGKPMKSYFYIIVICLLIIALIFQCRKASEAGEISRQNTHALTDTIIYFKNGFNTETASVKTLQLEKNQLKKLVIDKDASLKQLTAEFSKVKSVTKFNSAVNFDTIGVKFDAPIIGMADTIPALEKEGLAQGKWFSMGYKITNDSLIIAPFSTWTETTVITGFKRKWLLGRQTLTTDITTTNPHITISAIKSAEVIVPEPWYKKWYLWLAAGIAGGMLLK
jgi:hypothetical protein